ncbi:MAG: hypothetical protein QOE44_1328, partial [Solirubrobacteraceae bacterium]|nr:hypothetical protein [Solirubrobacteraceae bacterium]
MAIIGSHGPKHRPPRSRALLAALVLGGSLGLSGTADGFVYWDGYVASPTSIDRANLDGSGVTAPFVTIGNDNPCGVAVDHGHIYWGGSSGSEIGRANLDGSGAANGFVTGAVEPCGVAVDAAHVYWASYGRGAPGVGTTIGRASLDGTGVNQSFVTGAVSPCGVAVDAGHVYWANSGSGTIGRANLDGSGADPSFITGATEPCGVAVDAGHVYWTDRLPNGGGTIGRANLDGTGADQSFIADAAAGAPMGGTLCGIAVDAGHVYWDTSDFGSGGRIVRANLDGTGVDRGFVTIPGAGSASTPCGVAVDVLLPSTTTVSGSPSSSVYGQPVSLTATVVNAPSPAPIIPTGAVQFAINGDTVTDPIALGSDGRATFTPPDPLDVGDEVTAEYTGNAQLGPSTSPILLPAVQPAASSLVLRS